MGLACVPAAGQVENRSGVALHGPQVGRGQGQPGSKRYGKKLIAAPPTLSIEGY